jgi:hypothetical protein
MCKLALTLAIVFAFALPGVVHGETSGEKREAILELMNLTGAGTRGAQVAQGLLAQLKPIFPQVPDELWREFLASFGSDELTELIVPIYSRHFSLDEIRGLVAFYRTPLGEKVLATLPSITAESIRVGQEWGAAKARELIERLEERGYEPLAL